MQNTADFRLAIGHHVNGLPAAGRAGGFVLAKVDAANQLAHHQKVDAGGAYLGPQGAGVGQGGQQAGGPQVGKQAHALADAQKALLGALVARQALPLGAAHRAQQHGIAGQAHRQGLVGQGVAHGVYGGAAHQHLAGVEAMAKPPLHGVQRAQRLLYNFGANAVPTNNRNAFFHWFAPLKNTHPKNRYYSGNIQNKLVFYNNLIIKCLFLFAK